MFEYIKKKLKIYNKNDINEVNQHTLNQSEVTSIIKLRENIDEIKSAYSLLEKRVLSYKMLNKLGPNEDVGIINSINLFYDELMTNIRFMSNNNKDNIYNELIVEFNALKILFEELTIDVKKQRSAIGNKRM